MRSMGTKTVPDSWSQVEFGGGGGGSALLSVQRVPSNKLMESELWTRGSAWLSSWL